MLEVSKLSKNYGKTQAVKNVNFTVNAGEVAVLAGPNGAGKSTIIKSIAGLLKYEGKIEICGYDNKSIKGKSALGYIPELPSLFPLLTISEHLTLMAHAFNIKNHEKRAEELLKLFDLWDKKDKYGSDLSKGMQQKASICCALITEPKVLLVDEPMLGLDPKAIRNMKELLIKLKNEGVAIVVSTHLLDSVQELWDRILIMKNGEFVLSKARSEFNNEFKSLEEIFFEFTEE
ncbi:ABC-type transporter ATP-binding protein EcsA [Clostridium pasteurianum DSM 525 = ATCC 6013]|uniref:ABC-type transporter ATP-binding protein EcsA n=1 Tax=Clostridium pasteurianum DSM 525 = ATCC 6013 TaxID=1262449 RepID=A0A0H3J5N6_CLOPA|nr:ABC transporter ATP-binding protein [Clostridium pasteurianum]AJA47213.1 ABC-type transporter ATP-binding protein EcsA [Clostridium pasteurianum DSM 525 = ATCC 6013]AJA51201.1 ABC-type transporter ATP-binding protein EcsA [Clostridium pasteurianum DSM 525 = ATCC 6013]AOZ77288.1 ABC transporter ATP-binding protein [Clostridium pasteurianum DSM 525 = ATCC 6013]AOZ81083.1 ABC transporter ATP-binding protein [Clostridium pasteurianum]ELP59402.1 ABC transporter ATP-binding protein [Clostridium p